MLPLAHGEAKDIENTSLHHGELNGFKNSSVQKIPDSSEEL